MMDHDLVFARDALATESRRPRRRSQDPDKVAARWRTVRKRLGLPEQFGLHDSRTSKINNGLDAGENPVEVAADARHRATRCGSTAAAKPTRRNSSPADRTRFCPQSPTDGTGSLPLFTRLAKRGLLRPPGD